MYVRATSPRFSRGRSTPAILAISPSPLSSAGFARATLLGGGTGRGAKPPSGVYPCRCLCRGFLQMMRVTPRRLTTLQCSQRAFTDGFTFIVPSSLRLPFERRLCRRNPPGGGLGGGRRGPLPSFEPVRDAAPRQVVGRQLDLHPVTREDADEVHP